MSQLISDLRAGGGLITSVEGGNNITVNTVGGVATVNVSGTTNHAVQIGNALGALTSLPLGDAGLVLTSNGPGLDPSFQDISAVTVAYGQVYNQSALLLPNGANVTFDSNGPLLSVAHIIGSDTITVNDTGLFMIQWSLQTDGFISSISLNVNGVSVPNLSYVTNPSIEAEYNGEGIVLLNSGDLVTLTIFSAGSSDLITLAGFTNASMTLQKLNVATGTADSAALFNTDAGLATVAGATINIVGGAGISTSGAGNTVTISAAGGASVTQINGDTGSAVGPIVTFTGLATAGSTVSFDASASSVVFNVSGAGANTYIGSGSGTNSTFAVSGATLNTALGANSAQNVSGGGNVLLGASAGGASLGGGANNVGIGNSSMVGAVGASNNVAVGTNTLSVCTGAQNVALGFQALLQGAAINNNIGIGFNAGLALTTDSNIAIGGQALQNASTGGTNIAIGTLAMANSSGSSNNIAIGTNALTSLVTGNSNVAIGNNAGTSYTTGIETNNIVIGADPGIAGESSVTRIGVTTSTTCFMGGINGVTPPGTLSSVVIDNNGQLGSSVISSFSAFKSFSTANATGGGGVVTIGFDTEIFDQNGDYDNTTFTFTAPVTGKYFFHGNIWLSNVLTATDTYLRISTSNREYTFDYRNLFATSASNIGAIQGTALADMDASDTCTIAITCDGQATTVGIRGGGGPETFFCGNLVH